MATLRRFLTETFGQLRTLKLSQQTSGRVPDRAGVGAFLPDRGCTLGNIDAVAKRVVDDPSRCRNLEHARIVERALLRIKIRIRPDCCQFGGTNRVRPVRILYINCIADWRQVAIGSRTSVIGPGHVVDALVCPASARFITTLIGKQRCESTAAIACWKSTPGNGSSGNIWRCSRKRSPVTIRRRTQMLDSFDWVQTRPPDRVSTHQTGRAARSAPAVLHLANGKLSTKAAWHPLPDGLDR